MSLRSLESDYCQRNTSMKEVISRSLDYTKENPQRWKCGKTTIQTHKQSDIWKGVYF